MANAVLMASGMGTRMRPLTEHTPKPLIKVKGIPMIESVIAALQKKGVEHIYIVVGYLGDQFEYLMKRYPNISIIRNSDYETINNISSIYYAREALRKGDCYICEADLYVSDDMLLTRVDTSHSAYFGTIQNRQHSDDWGFELGEDGYIKRIAKGGSWDYNMVGMAYFKADEAAMIADKVEARYHTKGYEDLFWDDVVNENLNEIKLTISQIEDGDITEIDTPQELEAANSRM